MKILESRPGRYDIGINLLSGGHATKIKKKIVKDYVKPNMHVLDIGCGTGLFLELAASKGAIAKGIDISTGMLKVAQNRIKKSGLQNKISIYNASAIEIGSLFTENSFDLIVSTLVFSELYTDERTLVLTQIKKLLKRNGKLVIATEVKPHNLFKRIVHFIIRLPLTILTYIVSQTGTKPFTKIKKEVTKSGFIIINEELSFLDSFVILSAVNSVNISYNDINLQIAKKPTEDFSIFKSIWDYIGRWFPNPVEPGLRVIGKPGRDSPVILTSNYHLTVRRVEKSLKNENVFLLVAPTNGVNVWCGATGGELNTHCVITVIKTSRLNERVNHNKIILPQFSASGIDLKLLNKETGRKGYFGPAYSKDLPNYLKNHKTVFENNKADFSFPFRLEMLLSMNFIIWFGIMVVSVLIAPKHLLHISLFFWITGLILYAGYPIIPGKSGWLKAGILSIVEITTIIFYAILILNVHPFVYWDFILGLSVINLVLGFDLRGIVSGYPSEAEWLLKKLGIKSIGHIFSAEKRNEGLIQQDIDKCNNCRICLMVCPKGVFAVVGKMDIRVRKRSECFACNACVTQCTENALELED